MTISVASDEALTGMRTGAGELLTSDGDHVQNHGRLDLDEAVRSHRLTKQASARAR